jgi:hypothetical protein
MAEAGVIGMRVRNDCPLDRLPGVDIKVARGAIKAFGTRDDQVFGFRQSSSPWCAICHACVMHLTTEFNRGFVSGDAPMVDSAGKVSVRSIRLGSIDIAMSRHETARPREGDAPSIASFTAC